MSLRWLLLAAGAAFLAVLAFTAPLRLVLGGIDAGRMGLSAKAVEGGVWAGVLRQADFRGLALGDVRAGLDPLSLAAGSAGLKVAASGSVNGRGVLALGPGRFTLSRADARMPLEALAPGLPLSGQLVLRGFKADFRQGACHEARGDVALEALKLGGVPVAGLRLSGKAACRDRLLVVPLSGQGQGVLVDATLRLDGAGTYQLVSRLRATDPMVQAAAAAAGFERGLDGYARTDRGRLGG